MLAGTIEISHQALDQRDTGQATAYLRAWMVADGILEARDERLARFGRWAKTTVAGLPDHPDRAHLAAYASWHLRPDFARRAARGETAPSSHRYFYAKLRIAAQLVSWLHEHDRILEQLRQSDIDTWIAPAPSRALPTRSFTDWAHTTGLIPKIQIRRPATRQTAAPRDDATRLAHVGRLLDSDDLERGTRIAGCLVLLYGQHATRIAALKRDDLTVNDSSVALRLGHDPISITGPLARLLRDQHTHTYGSWLLPGAKPGSHIGPERIRRRLRQLDIRPSDARPSGLLALAASVPAPVLGELLGYCDDTANHWRRAAAGDWARYASLAATPTC